MKYALTSRSRWPAWIKILLSAVLALVCVVMILAIAGYTWYQRQLLPLTADSVQIAVVIEPGSSASQIAQQLEDQKVIRSALAFERYVAQSNARSELQAGTYQLDSVYSVQEITEILTKGKVSRGLFTIIPGLRLDQIKQKMVDSGFSAASVNSALEPTQYQNHPALIGKPAQASLEGYLFPDSYERTSQTTATDIVKQSLDQMANALTDERIQQFKAQGLNSFQAVTLASIVVKEASSAQEQPKIAGVFLNRLRQGMQLGSDVTYQYIADVQGIDRNANIDSPYNTRMYKGLPPGPIANVTNSSLDAVAQPLATDYLYFVAGDDGKIYYSRTQAEHEALANQHCIELCATY